MLSVAQLNSLHDLVDPLVASTVNAWTDENELVRLVGMYRDTARLLRHLDQLLRTRHEIVMTTRERLGDAVDEAIRQSLLKLT